MRVELNPQIQSLSGRMGNLIFRTVKRADGEIRVYANKASDYQRSTPLSDNEIKNRDRFEVVNRTLRRLWKAGDKRPRKVLWHIVADAYDAGMDVTQLEPEV